MRVTLSFVAALAVTISVFTAEASDAPPPGISSITRSNGININIRPAPATEQYILRSGGNFGIPFTNDASGSLTGLTFRVTNDAPMRFYNVGAMPMSSNALLSSTILNRLAYGPTPDELERIAQVGPQAWIEEQLAPESVTDPLTAAITEVTNSAPNAPTGPRWFRVAVTGLFSTNSGSTNFYIYPSSPGEFYIDDVMLVEGTEAEVGQNLLLNGDFESAGLAPWSVSANLSGSGPSTTYVKSGAQSLRMVATGAGSSEATSIFQRIPRGALTNRQPMTLSFWYLATTNSREIIVRASGNWVYASGADAPPAQPKWIYAEATGRATGTPQLYIYMNGAGSVFLDDVKLVHGSVAGQGANLLPNGDFETLALAPWIATTNFSNTVVSTEYAHSGAGSLKIVASAAGAGSGNSVYQTSIAGVTNNGTYTLSFWYLAPVPGNRTLTARLSGSLLVANAEQTPASIERRFTDYYEPSFEDGRLLAANVNGPVLSDLRAWFVQNAVYGKRQLVEVLSQFLENHFVTQHSKSQDYLDGTYDGSIMDSIAAEWEFREMKKWRNALLRPDVTFLDLLTISAESPAMIVYLDTVNSKGNGNNIANENYARELFELFCMGVDNGYDQQDITVMSRAWTGWSVDIVDPDQVNNPLAPPSTTYGFYPGASSTSRSNLAGIWTFRYKAADHGTNRAPIFSVWDPASPATSPRPLAGTSGKQIPARFGPPWANTSYQLALPARGIGGSTNGIQDGYDVLNHLANLPFTMEYISVKLCRLFVHDDFEHGVYDYTDPNRSAEAELVRQCMMAWWNSNPRGQLRPVLQTIFNSDLFRSHGGSLQKVKTPLEFTASAVRALMAQKPDGTYTAFTDGYAFSSPIDRMGSMKLFNRAEPDGYPESGPPWISAGTLAERVRYVQSLNTAGGSAGRPTDAGASTNDPVALLKLKLPSNQWSDAGLVAGYFVRLLYPGEGAANLELYRGAAINYLNTGDTGAPSAFNTLANTSSAYDTRIRGMVAMLMSFERFQEQ